MLYTTKETEYRERTIQKVAWMLDVSIKIGNVDSVGNILA